MFVETVSSINEEVDDFTFEYCDNSKSFSILLNSLEKLPIIGVDTETTGLDPSKENERLRLVTIGDDKRSVVFDIWKLNSKSKIQLSNFIDRTDKKKVFHNAKFDMKFLITDLNCKLDEKVFCTQLASQLIAGGQRWIHHSLKDLVWKYFNKNLAKELQASDWSKFDLSNEQIKYAATDVKFLIPLREKLLDELKKLDLILTSKIEYDGLLALCEKELTGFYLNQKTWKRTADRNKLRMIRMQNKMSRYLEDLEEGPKIQTLFEVPLFKITDQQIKKRLNRLGIEVPKTVDKVTGEEKDTLNLELVERYKDRDPIFPMIIKHSSLKKGYTSYGYNWLEKVNPNDGRIHEDYKQIGSETGRISCGMHTVPQEYIYRRCFCAPEGKTLVWADYSQAELRILAELCQDPQMVKAFIEGLDLHTNTASLLFETPYEQVTSAQRKRAKNLNFGIVYGIGPTRFANAAEISFEEACELIKNYFRAYPYLKLWLDDQEQNTIMTKQARTLSGRLGIFEFDEKDQAQKAMVGRNGKNFPIQALSADITKLALGYLVRKLNRIGKIVHSMHDEIILECDISNKDECSEILRTEMQRAGQFFMKRVPMIVDVQSHHHWRKEPNKWAKIIKENGLTYPDHRFHQVQ